MSGRSRPKRGPEHGAMASAATMNRPLRSRRMRRDEGSVGDSAIRAALLAELRQELNDDPEAVVIEELGLCRGQVRLDVATVSGLLHGYEIKSDRDSLYRLQRQVDTYNKVLDRATLVVGDRFLAAAPDAVPSWWGLMHAQLKSGEVRLRTVRRSQRNPQRDPRCLAEMLWSNHAMEILEQRGAARGVRRKPRRVIWDRVCDCFSLDEIAAAVRVGLKARPMRRVVA